MKLPEHIERGTETVIGAEELAERWQQTNRKLRVKFGVDPTRADLTFGHLVIFNKLRQFQEEGHTVVLIIGDFTTLIGDPSGRSELRPMLTRETIEANASTYLDQAFRVLNKDLTEIRHNSEWFDRMSFEDCLLLAREMTVARMLERDDFAARYQSNKPISIVEFLYPLVQGHDSVRVQADVEIGGSDQLFNMLVGRQLQHEKEQPQQAVITMPLLVGLDGHKKMSKSADNYIAFNDDPKNMLGKLMSVSDDSMWEYYKLLLMEADEQIRLRQQRHPMEAKKELACRLTAYFHGEETAKRELSQFEQVFAKRELPDDIPEYELGKLTDSPESQNTLQHILAATGAFTSKKEIKRLIDQGAVKINKEKVNDPFHPITKESLPLIIQAGKRTFLKVV